MTERRVNTEGFVLIGMGVFELAISIPVAWLFGFSTADVLLVRDIVFAWTAALGYGLMLAGAWMVVKPLVFPGESGGI